MNRSVDYTGRANGEKGSAAASASSLDTGQRDDAIGSDSLTGRASRIAINRLLQHVARLAVGVLATPIIILALGPVRYGAWLVLQQSVSYLGALDFQSMGTLRYRLALAQHDPDSDKKRRFVGAALWLWVVMLLPLGLAAGVVVYFAPQIVGVDRSMEVDLRWAFAISAFAIALGRLASLPSNILRGENRDYSAEFSSGFAILLGGVLSVGAVKYGFGLSGLAAAGIVGTLLLSAIQYRVMIKVCPWFGVALPRKGEVLAFTKLSGALLASGLSLFLLLSTDMIVTAHVVSLEAAALLGTTGAALRFSIDPLQQLLSASSAGLVGLCGRSEWSRVSAIQDELQIQSLVLVGWIGACIVLLNQSFLSLWLGPQFFGGSALTVSLVVLAIITVLLRNDGILLDAIGLMRQKTWLTLTGCLLSVTLGVLFGMYYGLPGIVAGLCCGRLPVLWWQRRWLEGRMQASGVVQGSRLGRLMLATLSLILIFEYCSRFVAISSWWSFALVAFVAGLVAAGWLGWLGLRGRERIKLISRFRTTINALKKRSK